MLILYPFLNKGNAFFFMHINLWRFWKSICPYFEDKVQIFSYIGIWYWSIGTSMGRTVYYDLLCLKVSTCQYTNTFRTKDHVSMQIMLKCFTIDSKKMCVKSLFYL